MEKDLHKRLEEVISDSYMRCLEWITCGNKNDWELAFKEGAEYGYKEAIKVAKEWLLENTISHYNPDTDARWVDTNECEDSKEFAYRFETFMNKLWEDKK